MTTAFQGGAFQSNAFQIDAIVGGAKGLLDRCIFTPAAGGAADFVVVGAVQGFMTPAQAGGVDATQYHYAAQTVDGSGNILQWEVGTGTYSVATPTLARGATLFNSDGSQPGLVNFATSPQVMISALAEDFGAAGTPGAQGQAGPPGSQGDDGGVGDTGPPGPAGAAGAAGNTGAPGPQGIQGASGVSLDGLDGSDGDIGPPGATGATGAQGTAGNTGSTGPAGAQGNPGADGSDGIDGDIGPQGRPGNDGALGAIGPSGNDGDQGEEGMPIPGPQGPPGPQGIQGRTVSGVTLTSIVVDVSASFRRSGTVLVDGSFASSQIGKPVLIYQAPSADDADEHDHLLCTAEIISATKLRLRWLSATRTLVRGRKRFNYLISA